MDTPTPHKALSLVVLPVIMMGIAHPPVSADSCISDGLTLGEGAAVSNRETYGCRNTFCYNGFPGYYIILFAGPGVYWQRVDVNLRKACNSSSDTVIFEKTTLVLMSGYPISWILTGFRPGTIFLVGGGKLTDETSGTSESHLLEIPDLGFDPNLRQNIPWIRGHKIKDIRYKLQEKIRQLFGWEDGWPFDEHVASSINYAWNATSWTLTVGEDCCKQPSASGSNPIWKGNTTSPSLVPTTKQSWITIPAPIWKGNTTIHTDNLPDAGVKQQPNYKVTHHTSGPSALMIGIIAVVGALVLIIIIALIITIIWCHRRNQSSTTRTTSQTTQLNTLQGQQTTASGPTSQPSGPAVVNYFGPVVNYIGTAPPQQATANASGQSHPIPNTYPAGGPPPSSGPAGHHERPPPFNPQVDPSAPPVHNT